MDHNRHETFDAAIIAPARYSAFACLKPSWSRYRAMVYGREGSRRHSEWRYHQSSPERERGACGPRVRCEGEVTEPLSKKMAGGGVATVVGGVVDLCCQGQQED